MWSTLILNQLPASLPSLPGKSSNIILNLALSSVHTINEHTSVHWQLERGCKISLVNGDDEPGFRKKSPSTSFKHLFSLGKGERRTFNLGEDS